MPDLITEYKLQIEHQIVELGPLYLFGAALDSQRSREAKLLHFFLGDARRQGDERVVRACEVNQLAHEFSAKSIAAAATM